MNKTQIPCKYGAIIVSRTLTASEINGLSQIQKTYLFSNPRIVSLQPHELAREALYQTRHGAVTIDRAMELDEISIKPLKLNKCGFDNYSNDEDNFIDENGMSSGLY